MLPSCKYRREVLTYLDNRFDVWTEKEGDFKSWSCRKRNIVSGFKAQYSGKTVGNRSWGPLIRAFAQANRCPHSNILQIADSRSTPFYYGIRAKPNTDEDDNLQTRSVSAEIHSDDVSFSLDIKIKFNGNGRPTITAMVVDPDKEKISAKKTASISHSSSSSSLSTSSHGPSSSSSSHARLPQKSVTGGEIGQKRPRSANETISTVPRKLSTVQKQGQ